MTREGWLFVHLLLGDGKLPYACASVRSEEVRYAKVDASDDDVAVADWPRDEASGG